MQRTAVLYTQRFSREAQYRVKPSLTEGQPGLLSRRSEAIPLIPSLVTDLITLHWHCENSVQGKPLESAVWLPAPACVATDRTLRDVFAVMICNPIVAAEVVSPIGQFWQMTLSVGCFQGRVTLHPSALLQLPTAGSRFEAQTKAT
jgi:hypothetical protein